MKFDFVGIGDVVVDTFLELEVAKISDGESGKIISMPFAEKIPFKKETIVAGVGNSANACVSAARIGLSAAFFGIVGNDHNGELCKNVFKSESIAPFIQQSDKQTNHHIVLSYNADRTILVNHQPYDYSTLLNNLNNLEIKTLYISSLSEDAEILYTHILEYVKNNPRTFLVFQPGTYQLKFAHKPVIQEMYQRCNLLVLNKEEAELITHSPHKTAIHILVKQLHSIGPKTIAVTDGPNGAYLSHAGELVFLPAYPDIAPPVERTGAGDAFASTLASFVTKGYEPLDAFMRAPINSMNVVQYIGAQQGLLSAEKIEEYLKLAPASYHPQQVRPL